MNQYSKEILIPPHGYVRYIDHLGTDERIVEAARVSYRSPSKGAEADQKLLEYLYKNRHTSPFEQCSITFNIKFPIFLMRQFVRHRTFRLNEVSARYTELPDQFFLPFRWRVQDNKNRQGSVVGDFSESWQSSNNDIASAAYQFAYEGYKALLERGIAKEQARMVLPVGIYTEIYVNTDLNNLLKFFTLRQDSHAQAEIQDVSNAMFEIFADLFPGTAKAFQTYKFQLIENANNN